MKKKTPPAKKPTPRSVSVKQATAWCEAKGINPDHLFTDAERMWEWAKLRRDLQENVALLDERFSQLAEKRHICPIVLLLDAGPIE